MQQRISKKVSIFLLSVQIFLQVSFFAFPVYAAGDLTSSNFLIRGSIIDDSGGVATSSTYTQISAFNQIAVGESTSTNFTLQSGVLYFSTTTLLLRSQNWRWYTDQDNETPTSALAAENTAPTEIAYNEILKLRTVLKENGGYAVTNLKLRVQYSTSTTFADGTVNDVMATTTCTSTSLWCYADGGGVDNAGISTKVLTDADSCTSSTGNGCGTHNEEATTTSTFTHPASAAVEYEFVIKNVRAVADTVYYFRLFDHTNGEAIVLTTGKTYPSLTSKGNSLTFTISGLASGVTTAGTTTSITTTSTTVPFGSLSTLSSASIGGQRLTVSTNATSGYTVYLSSTQALYDAAHGNTIATVSGSNSSPAAFAITGGQNGAFGYHSSDATLGTGNTTRFAAADTYAALESTQREIAYYNAATTTDITDMMYKTQVNSLQAPGSYETTLIYVVAPVF